MQIFRILYYKGLFSLIGSILQSNISNRMVFIIQPIYDEFIKNDLFAFHFPLKKKYLITVAM